jgi:hypothetical protein
VAVFAFTVHPDEKDVRVAISKQNILLGGLIWISAGLFLIEAGVTIASLVSICVNRVLRCARDLAVVTRRVKCIGRRPVATITFLVVMAPPGFVSASDRTSTSDQAKPDDNVPFFLSVDNRGTFSYQSTATQPGITSKTAKQIFEFSHLDIWLYGTNLVIVDLLKSNHADPAAPCLSPTGPTIGCAGATEIYGFFRSTLGFNKILGTTTLSKGPLRDVSLLIGGDAQREDRYSSAYKHDVVAGLQLAFALPYKGFLNVSPLYYKEANHNAYARCDGGGIPGVTCLADGDIAYRGTWAVETLYYMDLDFLPAQMQYFGVRGRANFYGPKGGENSPLPSTPTKTESDSEPVCLIFDSGKAFWGSKHTHRLDVWVAYRYWENKYGFDHNASPVCMGQGAGSCVEKSFCPGITVKF